MARSAKYRTGKVDYCNVVSYFENSHKHNFVINYYHTSIFCVKDWKDVDRDGEVCGHMVFRTERYENIWFIVVVDFNAEVRQRESYAASYPGSLEGTQF
jgi:hypothetical protein